MITGLINAGRKETRKHSRITETICVTFFSFSAAACLCPTGFRKFLECRLFAIKKSDVVEQNHHNADHIKEEYNNKNNFDTGNCFEDCVHYQSSKST